MSSADLPILQGEAVPILLQLSDGESGLFPQAVVRNQNESVLATIDLVHAQNGKYKPAADYLMPNVNSLSIQFLIYEDSLHTALSSYEIVTDTFIRELVSDLVYKIMARDVEFTIEEEVNIVSKFSADDSVISVMHDDDDFCININEVETTISSIEEIDEIIGVIYEY